MMTRKKALGRGLDALIGGAAKAERLQKPADGQLRSLPVDLIRPGRYQPRSVFDSERLEELADSIRAQGVVQPVVVSAIDGGQYELIAGERRWRAAQLAGLEEIPAVIRQVPEEAIIAMALIENIQREDLNPLEQAIALQRLTEEFGMTHQQAADAVGRSRAAVSNLLRLLDLHDAAKALVNQGRLDMGHARALLALPSSQQPAIAKQIADKGLSVRQTEQWIKRLAAGATRSTPQPALSADIRRLQDRLTEQLGARVAIRHQSSGKGTLSIQYNSVDELDGILERIK